MVFSSLIFAFIFLPVTIVLYYISADKYKNAILLSVSILFYAYGEPQVVYIMIASIIINYFLAFFIHIKHEKKQVFAAQLILIVDVIVNLGLLFVFKYLDFSIRMVNQMFFPYSAQLQYLNIALPIGISFFTFQALSYVIDVYRGTVPVQKNPLYVALYISFFPQLVAGPIVRYSTIERQIVSRGSTPEKFAEGCRRFFLGFGKKIILANNLSIIAENAFTSDPSITNPAFLWLGSVCYSLQIYYDFSAYSDMAIGLGKMFGFEFEENFNYPYISASVTEFWRRWHISLSQWFRDYVYFPLGGSRVPVARHVLNLFVVWILTGIWHGAGTNFVMWGMFYFVLLVLEKYLVKPECRAPFFRVVWRAVTLLSVNFGWVIFNSYGLKNAVKYITAMLGMNGIRFGIDTQLIYHVREYGFFILTGVLFSTPVMRRVSMLAEKNETIGAVKAVIAPLSYGILFIIAVSYLVLGAHNPFIYFNF